MTSKVFSRRLVPALVAISLMVYSGCAPEGIPPIELPRVVGDYLDAHPEMRMWVRLEINVREDGGRIWLGYDEWPDAWKVEVEEMYLRLLRDEPLLLPDRIPILPDITPQIVVDHEKVKFFEQAPTRKS